MVYELDTNYLCTADKAAQAAAQAAQLGLGIGALGQMANLTPSQAMQLSNALQNLGNAGVTNTSVHNAIKHLAAATSGMRGQGESPSQSPASTPAPPSASGQVANNHPQQTPSLYNPNLDVFQPQENKQQFQRQPSPLGQVNFAGGAGAGSSASAPSSASVTNSAPPPANRTDPIFYMPSDKANFPDFSVMERERSLFKSFMKPESPGTPASTASYKSPTTAASFEDNFTTLTSPNPTNPMPSPPLKAMPANTLESFFKSREHNREQNTQQNIQQQHIHQSQQQLNQQQQQQQQQHYQAHSQAHKEQQHINYDGFLASEMGGMGIRDQFDHFDHFDQLGHLGNLNKQYHKQQRTTSPFSTSSQHPTSSAQHNRDIKNIWN